MNDDFLNNHPDFYTEKSVLDIAAIVAWKKSKNAYNITKFPTTAVISSGGNVLGVKQRLFSKKIKGLPGQNYIFGDNIFCSRFGNGAPAIISLMEELRILGVEHFLFAGFAGKLTETEKRDAFLVTKTFSTSGCTSFYGRERNSGFQTATGAKK
ncbi:hypothetical protein [Flavobacterium sp. 3HN19-14]|uniref:hypothetical protein n=1 Tax=Flavobacterium sp. 3HN19-14 TaxID=3448133 RepID=UPI003EDE7FCF